MVAAVSPDDDAFHWISIDDERGGVVLEGACVFGGLWGI
jgi:hypothetical protein